MEVENGPFDDHFPLQTGGFPLPLGPSKQIQKDLGGAYNLFGCACRVEHPIY